MFSGLLERILVGDLFCPKPKTIILDWEVVHKSAGLLTKYRYDLAHPVTMKKKNNLNTVPNLFLPVLKKPL